MSPSEFGVGEGRLSGVARADLGVQPMEHDPTGMGSIVGEGCPANRRALVLENRH
jgi:hypothetical protein